MTTTNPVHVLKENDTDISMLTNATVLGQSAATRHRRLKPHQWSIRSYVEKAFLYSYAQCVGKAHHSIFVHGGLF